MIRRSIEWFLGSVVVYLCVAACAGGGGIEGMMQMATGGLAALVGGNQGSGAEGSDGQGAESTGAQGSDGTGALGEGATGGTSIIDPVPDADAAEDGTRLVNTYWSTADGLKTASGFFDKQLNVPCFFTLTEGQKFRCIPNYSGVALSYYQNDTCTQRVGTIGKGGCVAGNYTYTSVAGPTCNGATAAYYQEVYEVGAKLTAPTIYTGTPESCTELNATTVDGSDFYQVTKVDPSTFVEGALVQGDQ